MAQLTCTNLTLRYGDNVLVRNLNFEVNAGDYLCIVGENGSGKSTLVRTLLHLQAPAEGKIEEGDGLHANEIGYLPQQTLVQRDFPASVREIVLSGCQARMGLRPFYNKEEKALADENMAKMDITHLADRCYRELSGGQQQRVLLARALCATRKLLFLDEPVSGLDPKATAEMYELIERLNRKERITIIMVSHDIHAALRYASHILHIEENVFFGTKYDYMKSPVGRYFTKLHHGKMDIRSGKSDREKDLSRVPAMSTNMVKGDGGKKSKSETSKAASAQEKSADAPAPETKKASEKDEKSGAGSALKGGE